jgi:hypothetical protein
MGERKLKERLSYMVYRNFFESELEKKKYDYSKEAVEEKKKLPVHCLNL